MAEIHVSLSAKSPTALPTDVIKMLKSMVSTLKTPAGTKVTASKGTVVVTVPGKSKSTISGTDSGTFSVFQDSGSMSGTQGFDNAEDALNFALGNKTKTKGKKAPVKASKAFAELMPVLVSAGLEDVETKDLGKGGTVLYGTKGDWDFVIVPGSGKIKYKVTAVDSEDNESEEFLCTSAEQVEDAIDIITAKTEYLDPGVYFAEDGTVFKSNGNPTTLLKKLAGLKTIYMLKPEEGPGYFFTEKPSVVKTDGSDLVLGVMFNVTKPGKIIVMIED